MTDAASQENWTSDFRKPSGIVVIASAAVGIAATAILPLFSVVRSCGKYDLALDVKSDSGAAIDELRYFVSFDYERAEFVEEQLRTDRQATINELLTPAEKNDSGFVVRLPFSEITNGFGIETKYIQPPVSCAVDS